MPTQSMPSAFRSRTAACTLASVRAQIATRDPARPSAWAVARPIPSRSEEHTSELQSHSDLVCRLLLEKKKQHNLARATGTHPHQPATVHTDRLRHLVHRLA